MSWSGYEAASPLIASSLKSDRRTGISWIWTMSCDLPVARYFLSHHVPQPASGLASGSGICCGILTSILA
jgi:hypothetical protein